MSENIRLLLVEDNPGDVRLIQEYLKDVPMMNLELGVVDTLEEAQKVLEEDNIDLVLLDLGLPDSAGLDTVVEVISQNPSVPVVVLTGLADNRRAMEAINGGAQDYLVKDLITTDVLIRSIKYSIHRKQSLVEIEESEEKYRSLWNNSANGLAYHELVTDDDGKPIDSIFLDVNTSFEKITGRRKEDVIGKRFSEVKEKLLPEGIELKDTFWKVARTGEPMSFEFHKEKDRRWFNVSVYSPSQGKFVCALQDITEKKNTEKDQKILAAAFEQSTDSISIVDFPGEIRYVNPSYERITGYTISEVIGKTSAIMRYYDDKFDDDFYKNVRDVTVRGDTWHGQVPIKRKDGSLRLLDRVIVPVRDKSNVITHFVGVSRDITEQVEAQKTLNESEEKFRSVFEESAIANSLYNSSGILIESNQAGVELVGAQSIEDLLGFNLFEDPNLPDDVKKRVLSGETVRFVSEFSFDIVKKHSLYNTSKSGILFLDVLIAPFGKTEQGSVLGYYVQLQDISDRKKNERQLLESEEKYRTLFESAQDGIFMLVDGIFMECNAEALKMFGCTKEQILGKTPFHFSPPVQPDGRDSKEKALERIKLALAGELQIFEWLHMKNDRTPFYTNVGLNAFSFRGKVVLQAIVRDITELKRAEVELQESEKLYRLLAENTFDFIWQIDLDTTFTYANQAVFRMFGFTPEEWIGSQLYEHCSPEAMKLISDIMLEAITQGSDAIPVTFEILMLRKDGIEIDVEITGNLILDDDNEPLGFQGTTRDITGRKRAEKALRESEEQHRMVLSSMSDLIFVFDKQDNYVEFYASDKVEPLVPPEVFMGKNVTEIMPLEVAQQITECSNRIRETGNHEEIEYSYIIDNEIRWFLAVLDIHQDGESTVAAVRDITLRKKAQDDVKKRESEYRTLVSNIPGAVYHCAFDENWTMLFLSDAFEKISGYPASDFIMNQTRSFTSIIHPDDRDFLNDEITKSVNQKEIYGLEYRIIYSDGTIRWIREHGQGIPDREGEVCYLEGILFDVTEEKLYQKEMTRLRDIQKASFELSLALGETLELDKIYKTIYNHIEQLMDTSIFIVSLYDWKTKHITAEYVITDECSLDVKNLPPIPLEDEGMGTQSQVIRTGKPLYLPDLVGSLEKTKTEYTLKFGGDVLEGSPPNDGRQRSRSAMYVPLLHASEVIGVMQVQSYDINAYSQDQLELLSNLANVVALAVKNAKLFETVEESEDRYRLLVENTLDGVYIRNDSVFLDMNQRMALMLGENRDKLIGTPAMDFWTPDSQERIKNYIRDGSTYAIELELLRLDGSIRLIEAFGKNCLYDGKDARIVAIRDISKQKKAQQETKQAADTALLYLDIMSHDVRNQLQAVVMASEIMQHMELDVESILALEIITESVEKSQKLINKVLSTRELLTVPLYEISLETALKNSLESLNELYEEIEIETKCSTKDPKVSADKFIEQLLLNILENAVEYNKRKDRKLWIDIQKSGQGYQILIKDNGQGISDAKKESLFDPSRRFGGVGIHQTIRILQKYEGHISVHDRVESDPTQGTEFRLWFPKARKRS